LSLLYGIVIGGDRFDNVLSSTPAWSTRV